MSESTKKFVQSLLDAASRVNFRLSDLGEFQSAKNLEAAMQRSVAASKEIKAPVAQTAKGKKFLGIKS